MTRWAHPLVAEICMAFRRSFVSTLLLATSGGAPLPVWRANTLSMAASVSLSMYQVSFTICLMPHHGSSSGTFTQSINAIPMAIKYSSHSCLPVHCIKHIEVLT